MTPEAGAVRPRSLLRPIPTQPDTRLRLLRRLTRPVRTAALASALEVASPAEADVFAAELLEILAQRRDLSTASTVARLFNRFPAHAQSAAMCVARDAITRAFDALDWTQPQVRASCAAAARAAASVGGSDESAGSVAALVRRLPDLLSDSDTTIAAAAEAAVANLASHAAGFAEADRAACEAVLLDSVAAFDRHRRRGVLLAVLTYLGTPAGLARAAAGGSGGDWLADATHPAQMAIRSLLRRSEDAPITAAAIVWLRVPAQSAACRDRLLAATTPADHAGALRLAHLLAHPARARALASAGGGAGNGRAADWRIDPESFAQLPIQARRMTPRWVASIALESRRATEQLGIVAADDAPLVRLAALTAPGIRLDPDALIDLAYDEDDSVARSASLALVRLNAERVRRASGDDTCVVSTTVSRLRRSPHPRVRAVCNAAIPDEHTPAARLAWRLALRRDRAGTLAELRDRLLMGAPRSRVAWITTCRVLGVASDLERDFCDLADEYMTPVIADALAADRLVLAATAVAALAHTSGERAGRILDNALRSSDPRISANALEAIENRAAIAIRAGDRRPHDAFAGRLIEFKDASAHRVRASAALALLRRLPQGAIPSNPTLGVMLTDPRPMHRLAGIWGTEHAAASAIIDPLLLIEPVQRLQNDEDAAVRARAERCRRRLGALAAAQELVV